MYCFNCVIYYSYEIDFNYFVLDVWIGFGKGFFVDDFGVVDINVELFEDILVVGEGSSYVI